MSEPGNPQRSTLTILANELIDSDEEPQTLNPKPQTLNPKPEIITSTKDDLSKEKPLETQKPELLFVKPISESAPQTYRFTRIIIQ